MRTIAKEDGNHKSRFPPGELTHMGNFVVAMEAAWLVRDVENSDDAIGVVDTLEVEETDPRTRPSG